MSPNKNNLSFNRFLFKVAGISGISTGIIAALFMLLLKHTVEDALILALLIFIATSLLVYFILKKLLNERLRTIQKITQNISQKRFEDYKRLSRKSSNDELDELVQQCVAASKTMEREIERLNKIENYRKEFIGDISHELKTPIFAVQGFIETLLDGAIDDETVNRQFLEKALKNTNRLTYLTKDLLEISQLETGELKSNIQRVNLHHLITEVIENIQYKAEEEGVLIQQKNIDKNGFVNADRRQLRQVFINLIENAIKYNKIGGLVTVSVKKGDDDNKVLVTVKDNGIGIEPEYLERITERFFRIDKSRSRQKGGTGLGLAIVKHIIEAHGEKLHVESTPGEGSAFSFTLQRI